MKFYIARIPDDDLIEVIDEPDFVTVSKYVNRVYGEDSDVDIYFEDTWKEIENERCKEN